MAETTTRNPMVVDDRVMGISANKIILHCLVSVVISLLFVGNIPAQEKIRPLTDDEKAILEQVQTIPRLLAEQSIQPGDIPNPHWRDGACQACHSGKPDRKNKKLNTKNINKMCNNCHGKLSVHDLIHPVGMVPTKKMLKQMPVSFRRAIKRGGGKITCISCHDLAMPCLGKRRQEQNFNPRFFLEGPYRDRTALCFKCHDKSKYQRLNAHDQISNKGQINEQICQLCHKDIEKLKTAQSRADIDFHVADDNLSAMCIGCHLKISHPGGGFSFTKKKKPNHLVAPDKDMFNFMRKQQIKNKVELPLQLADNRIFCATCHDPHEQGVIKTKNKPADKRLRLKKEKLCLQCHNK